jgi:hypothetical protein
MFFALPAFCDAICELMAPKPVERVQLARRPRAGLVIEKRAREELVVSATRNVLLRSTSSLTKISTACHEFCSRLSNAFTMVRIMEAVSAMARPMFGPFSENGKSFAPMMWWAAPARSGQAFDGAAFFGARANRELEGGMAMAMAAFTVAASMFYAPQSFAYMRT